MSQELKPTTPKLKPEEIQANVQLIAAIILDSNTMTPDEKMAAFTASFPKPREQK